MVFGWIVLLRSTRHIRRSLSRCERECFALWGSVSRREIDRPVAPLAFVHSDNVFGDAASLSNTSLKANQQTVSADTLIGIFDTVEVKEYDFRPPGADVDGQPLPSERRVGFIADDVKAALPWNGVTSSAASLWPVTNF